VCCCKITHSHTSTNNVSWPFITSIHMCCSSHTHLFMLFITSVHVHPSIEILTSYHQMEVAPIVQLVKPYPEAYAVSHHAERTDFNVDLHFEHSGCCCVNWCCVKRPPNPGYITNKRAVLYINVAGCPGSRLSIMPNNSCCGGDSTEGDNALVKQLPSQLQGAIPPAVWKKFVNHLLEAQDSVMPDSCLCCMMFIPFLGTHCLGICYLMQGPRAVVAEMFKVVEAYQPYFFSCGCVINMGATQVGRQVMYFISVEKIV
jgi:hypothetical protein